MARYGEADDGGTARDALRRLDDRSVAEFPAQYPARDPWAAALQLATNLAPQGRKNDFADAQRQLSQLVANELTLRFVLSPE
jgi:hypothetical protein